MKRILILAVLCLYGIFLVSSVSAGTKQKEEKAQEATIVVDCNAGDRISDALASTAVFLTIQISGICEEDVNIQRSRVTLLGGDPLLDGISPAANEFPPDPNPMEISDTSQALSIAGVNRITIENLRLSGGRFGLGINFSFSITLRNTIIDDHVFAVIIGESGSNRFEDTEISNNGVAGSRGIWLTNASSLTCVNCTIENYKTGILLTQGSTISISGSTVQNSRRAVDASSGSTFFSSSNTLEGNTLGGSDFSKGAIRLSGSASANLNNDTLSGRIQVRQNSIASLSATAQTVTSQ